MMLCEWLYVFVGRADFDFFVRFENTSSCIGARRHAGSSQTLSDCLRCRGLMGEHLLCYLGCSVVCCARGAKKATKFRKVSQQIVVSSAITG